MAFVQRSALSTLEQPRRKRRWLPRRFLAVYLIWLAVTALIVTPEIARYDAETSRLKELAAELAGTATGAREAAPRIAQAVQERLAPRDPAMPASSALGASAWSSWASGVGDEREAARLIVKLLLARDIPASVVVLSNSRTGFRHFAVGYEADGEWRLLDGLGGSEEFRAWSESNGKPLPALVKAEPTADGGVLYRPDNPFFDRYSFFDWHSVLGDFADVYQRVPFPSWITASIESPPIVTGLIKIAAAFGVLLVLRALWFAFVQPRRRASA